MKAAPPHPTLWEFVTRHGWFGDRGQAVAWSPILGAMDEALQDSGCRTCAILSARRGGKSTAAAVASAYHLLTVPRSYTLWAAGTLGSISDIFRQKILDPIARHPTFKRLKFEIAKDRVFFPEIGSTLQCVAPSEAAVLGKTLTCLVVDESRLVEEETIELLRPSLLGTGKAFFIGSAGRPASWWHRCFTDPQASDRIYRFATLLEAGNPSFDPQVFKDIEEDRRRAESRGAWASALWRREHTSEFSSLSENPLVSPESVERASVEKVDGYDPDIDVVILGIDLSVTRDVSSIVALGRRPGGAMRILEIFAFDPKASGTEVPFEVVEKKIIAMSKRYKPRKIVGDDYQLVAIRQRLRQGGVHVEGVRVTAPLNQEAFTALSEALTTGRLKWAKHARLEEEIRGLELEETLSGFKIRDGGKYHRDISFSLALCVWQSEKLGDFKREANYDASRLGGAEFAPAWQFFAPDPKEKSRLALAEAEASYNRAVERMLIANGKSA